MRSLLLFEQGRTPTSKMARPAVLFRLRVKDSLAEYIEVRQVRPSNRTDEVIHLNAYVRSWWLVQTSSASYRRLASRRWRALGRLRRQRRSMNATFRPRAGKGHGKPCSFAHAGAPSA